MAEYTLEIIDERPVIELTEEVYEFTMTTGPQGPKGDAGTGISVKGSKDDPSELPGIPTTPDEAWLIDGDIYVWDGDSWLNAGHIQGPQGLQGQQGVQGIQGLKGDKGDQGDTMVVVSATQPSNPIFHQVWVKPL